MYSMLETYLVGKVLEDVSHTRLSLVPGTALDDNRETGGPGGECTRFDTGDFDA